MKERVESSQTSEGIGTGLTSRLNPSFLIVAYRLVLAASVLVLLVLVWRSFVHPLGDVHWDEPGYLIKGQSFADGGFVSHIIDSKEAVEAQTRAFAEGGPFPGVFWNFTRFGHIVTIGAVLDLGMQSVVWFYASAFTLGVLFLVISTPALLKNCISSREARFSSIGGAASFLSFMLSDIAGYMFGNPVSEVLVFFLLSSAFVLLSHYLAQEEKKHLLLPAITIGMLAFLVYVVRMESVLSIGALLIAAVAVFGLSERRDGGPLLFSEIAKDFPRQMLVDFTVTWNRLRLSRVRVVVYIPSLSCQYVICD